MVNNRMWNQTHFPKHVKTNGSKTCLKPQQHVEYVYHVNVAVGHNAALQLADQCIHVKILYVFAMDMQGM